MFEYCLAPNVYGDGTGCDNMTCIIVRFKNLIKNEKKRDLESPLKEENGLSKIPNAPEEKKIKLGDE